MVSGQADGAAAVLPHGCRTDGARDAPLPARRKKCKPPWPAPQAGTDRVRLLTRPGPVGVAANVCGTTVAFLSATGCGDACTAKNSSRALGNIINRQVMDKARPAAGKAGLEKYEGRSREGPAFFL